MDRVPGEHPQCALEERNQIVSGVRTRVCVCKYCWVHQSVTREWENEDQGDWGRLVSLLPRFCSVRADLSWYVNSSSLQVLEDINRLIGAAATLRILIAQPKVMEVREGLHAWNGILSEFEHKPDRIKNAGSKLLAGISVIWLSRIHGTVSHPPLRLSRNLSAESGT